MYKAQGLTYNQMRVLLTSSVFIYPEILPESRFIDLGPDKQRRVAFSPAEDVWVTLTLRELTSAHVRVDKWKKNTSVYKCRYSPKQQIFFSIRRCIKAFRLVWT